MPKKIVRGADTPRSVVNDPRFSSMHSAPIFKKIKKDSNKIKVDERFQTVLTDDRFRAVPGAIDIYGRQTKKSLKSAAAKELNSFYQVDDGTASKDDEPEENAIKTVVKAKSKAKGLKDKSGDSVKSEDPESRLDYLNRLARGDLSGSSSEDEDSEDEGKFSDIASDDSEDDDDFLETSTKIQKGPLDMLSDEEDEEDGEEAHATCRLALMNCDWDSLKAQDLMSVLQSFCPTGKTVDVVTVYPSDFGKEKMANEAIHGPPKIWTGGDDTPDDDDGSDGSEGDSIVEDEEDEGYGGIAAIDDEETVIKVKQGDKWKSSNNVKTGTLTLTATTDKKKKKLVKEKVSKADRKGDFKRLPGTVGIVLQDDLVSRGLSRGDDAHGEEAENSEEEGTNYFDGDISKDAAKTTANMKHKKRPVKGNDKRVTLERERFTGAGKGDEDGEGGFDEVALRAYELSKLKYYFAVAELSSVDTAEALMTQLDGVELGHSSMIFDLRFIPEDTRYVLWLQPQVDR